MLYLGMKNFVFGLLLLLFTPNVAFGQERTITDLGVETIDYGNFSYVYDGNPFNDNLKSLSIFSFIYVSKSDLKPEKIEIRLHRKRELTTYNSWELIFDDDRSTYLKIDRNNAKNITSLDHEIFLKFKKHRKVSLRQTIYKRHNDEIVAVKDYSRSLTGFTAAYNKYREIEAPTIKNRNKYKVANGLANVNPFNLDRYIDKFILDAKTNHNIDLSYVNEKDKLILFRELEGETIAAAYKMNEDDSVLVLVDPENWYDANQAKRWYIIYHELGHDVLNLKHGECGPMMNETTSGNYSWDRLEKDKNIMFEKYKSKQ